MIKVLCKKTLFNCGQCFTKGETYYPIYKLTDRFTEDTRLRNDQDEPHSPGGWFKHFKVIK